MNIKKVVIPAAGLGTRFLPLTKSIPKEMLPLFNKPAIQYIVEEAINSKINDFCIITSKGKEAISNYFDKSSNFNDLLKDRNKFEMLSGLDLIINSTHFNYVNQDEQLGLGHAILMAKEKIKDDYFGVMLPDDIIISNKPALEQLIFFAKQENASIIAVQEVPLDSISSYGVVAIKNQINSNLFEISGLVEKPNQKNAPSNLAIIGRYILSNKIFDSLEKIKADHRGEIQLTDAIANMLKNGEKVFACKTEGQRYDIGTPKGWLHANVEIQNYF